MASFQFRGSAIGQNATDIVIDDVNDMNTAKSLAEARYPGYKITNGMKLGGSGYSAPTSSASSSSTSSYSYPVGGVNNVTQSDSYDTTQSDDANSAFGGFLLGVTWWATTSVVKVTWMTAKFAIKCCIETLKLGLNYVVRPVLFATSYVLRHSVHVIAVSSIWAINKCDEFTTGTGQLIESGTANRWQF